jgi:hypothetical protein
MGYHKISIDRGTYGEFSKIEEEFMELKDAFYQDDKILELCETSDLIGAIEGFLEKRYGMTLEDVIKFSNKTKEAFIEGKR